MNNAMASGREKKHPNEKSRSDYFDLRSLFTKNKMATKWYQVYVNT